MFFRPFRGSIYQRPFYPPPPVQASLYTSHIRHTINEGPPSVACVNGPFFCRENGKWNLRADIVILNVYIRWRHNLRHFRAFTHGNMKATPFTFFTQKEKQVLFTFTFTVSISFSIPY